MVTPPQNHRDHHGSPGPPGVTFTFPLDPGKSISHPQQAVLPLPTHSCYPVPNDLKLFPLSGLLLLVLEIIPKISILPDSWPLPELTPLDLFLEERAAPRGVLPHTRFPGAVTEQLPARSLRFAALPPFSNTLIAHPLPAATVSSERPTTACPTRSSGSAQAGEHSEERLRQEIQRCNPPAKSSRAAILGKGRARLNSQERWVDIISTTSKDVIEL